jgi:hypothetical protein
MTRLNSMSKNQRKLMRRNHHRWPLGTRVIVTMRDGTEAPGRVFRHIRDASNSCDVRFDYPTAHAPGPLWGYYSVEKKPVQRVYMNRMRKEK